MVVMIRYRMSVIRNENKSLCADVFEVLVPVRVNANILQNKNKNETKKKSKKKKKTARLEFSRRDVMDTNRTTPKRSIAIRQMRNRDSPIGS